MRLHIYYFSTFNSKLFYVVCRLQSSKGLEASVGLTWLPSYSRRLSFISLKAFDLLHTLLRISDLAVCTGYGWEICFSNSLRTSSIDQGSHVLSRVLTGFKYFVNSLPMILLDRKNYSVWYVRYYFTRRWNKMSYRRNLRRGYSFWLTIQTYSWSWQKREWKEYEATGHLVSTFRKQRAVHMCGRLAFFFLHSSWPQPLLLLIFSVGIPTSINLSGNSLTDDPENYLLGKCLLDTVN